jgi:hypothetical protein
MRVSSSLSNWIVPAVGRSIAGLERQVHAGQHRQRQAAVDVNLRQISNFDPRATWRAGRRGDPGAICRRGFARPEWGF